MRLAWFSPMPPVRTGIARDSAALVAALGDEHGIDVFVDRSASSPAATVCSAHDFLWMHRRRPYDLTVFQMGNAAHHDFIWPYLFRYPGLAVLHDAHLHHARAASLLREHRAVDYRAEFVANHPGARPDAAELAVAGYDSYLYYLWPMTRLIVAASRVTAVHSETLAEALRIDHPTAAIEAIRLGHGTAIDAAEGARYRDPMRQRHGIPQNAILFGVFGGLTRDKRIEQVLDAFAATAPQAPDAWLVLAGAPAPHFDAAEAVRTRGLADRVVITGYIEQDDDLTALIAATDVTLNLRWPTAREMSGPWLRCLAAGKPSIVIDLVQTARVPALDPRTWASNRPHATVEPVCVAIDILDEDHSLRLAMRRLASDRPLRERLGRAARAHWDAQHSIAAMAADYRRVLPLAAARPAPVVDLPRHLDDDGGARVDELLAPFGLASPLG